MYMKIIVLHEQIKIKQHIIIDKILSGWKR